MQSTKYPLALRMRARLSDIHFQHQAWDKQNDKQLELYRLPSHGGGSLSKWTADRVRPHHFCIPHFLKIRPLVSALRGSKIGRFCPIAFQKPIDPSFLIQIAPNLKHFNRREVRLNGTNFTEIEQGIKLANFAIFYSLPPETPNIDLTKWNLAGDLRTSVVRTEVRRSPALRQISLC